MINNLRKFRNAFGFSQQELADLVECSRNTISSIERNEYSPSLDLAFHLADVLNCTIQSLFDFADKYRIYNVNVNFTECDICPKFECVHCKNEVFNYD